MTNRNHPHSRRPDEPYVSTGSLPGAGAVTALVNAAYDMFRDEHDGECSKVYPALERANPADFAIAVTSVGGEQYVVGDSAVQFTLMSVSKPFVLAIVCAAIGADRVRDFVGVNATGLPFNSVEAVERSPDGRTNPLVNSGAIATTSLVPGNDLHERWEFIVDGLSRFAGRELRVDDEVLSSALATNGRNRAIARLLHSLGALATDPDEATESYTRQCCLAVDVADLSLMGATLANGGTNPVTGDVVVSPSVCHDVLAIMATAGLYDESGDWLWRVGLPGKSGISGGIVTVSPGKGSVATYSPPLDHAGNSVRGRFVAEYLAVGLGIDLFATNPVVNR
jgi:glutaminase